jgi:hypothetical protein
LCVCGVVVLQCWRDVHLAAVSAPVLIAGVTVFVPLSELPGILEVSIHPVFENLVVDPDAGLPGVVACGFVDNASVSADVVAVASCPVPALAVAFEVVKAKGRHVDTEFGDKVTLKLLFEVGELVVGHGHADSGKVVLFFKFFDGGVDGCLECR